MRHSSFTTTTVKFCANKSLAQPKMTAATLLMGGNGVVPRRRPSATFVFEMPNQNANQRQWHNLHQQQQFVPSLTNGFAAGSGRSEEFFADVASTAAEPQLLQQKQQAKGDDLPANIWRKIGLMAGPLDRIRIGQCCKRMREAMGGTKWTDVLALDIRPIDTDTLLPVMDTIGRMGRVSVSSLPRPSTSSSSSSSASSSLSVNESSKKAFRIRIALSDGRTFRLRTEDRTDVDTEKLLKLLLERIGGDGLRELTIWNGCLSDRFRGVLRRCCTPALRTLRLWNCGRYLANYASSKQRRWPSLCPSPWRLLLPDLLALPHLRRLLILDSVTPEGSSSSSEQHQFPDFCDSLARAINAPLEELQLTACRLPLNALQLLRFRCAHSLRRLAIGCTWGNERKRELYLRELGQFKALADMDLPPFLFCITDNNPPDPQVRQLFEQLPQLRAIGLRHFKSSILFRFIEQHLPDQINALRVYHSVHRVPNFAELGHSSSCAHLSSACQSVRSSGSVLLGHSTGGGSPDSHRGLFHKKGSIVSQRSSLLSSSHSSVRSDSLCSAAAAAFPCRSSVSLRSVSATVSSAASSAIAVPLSLRACQSSSGGSSTVTTAGSCPLSIKSSSSSSLGGGGDSPSSTAASLTPAIVGIYRGKSLSLGGEVCAMDNNNNSNGMPTKEGTTTKWCHSMPTSSTWCALSTRSIAYRKRSIEAPPPAHCQGQPSSNSDTCTTAEAAQPNRLTHRRRWLTVVVVAEERIGGRRRRRTRKDGGLRENWHSGIKVVYVSPAEARHSQDILGRMGSPIEAPFMYYDNKNCVGNTKNDHVRFIDGDIVCPLPISEFGMESDYENEEEDAEGGDGEVDD